jgi:hypothetical protein
MSEQDLNVSKKDPKEKDPDKWKMHLLDTSVPLEHDAARILTTRGFSITSHPYLRSDRSVGGVEKENSIDLRGVKMHGPTTIVHPPAALDVLVECKYRHRGMRWLFIQEPAARHDSIQNAVIDVDLFSSLFVTDVWTNDHPVVPVCYSYVELGEKMRNNDASEARDSHIKHGVRQLQYAVPSLVTMRARWTITRRLNENYPFFFALVLVTNATLMVVSPEFGISTVENAHSVQSLGKEVPCLLLSQALGPDFYSHAQRELPVLTALTATNNLRAVEEHRAANAGLPDWLQPSDVISRIAADGGEFEQLADCTNIVVVNVNALSMALEALDKAFRRKVDSLKTQPLRTW